MSTNNMSNESKKELSLVPDANLSPFDVAPVEGQFWGSDNSNPYAESVEVPRRVMVLFFVIDTSGSMRGDKIGAVNTAIEEVIPTIKKISNDNADAEIKVAILQFDNNASWITPIPTKPDDLLWNDIKANGLTALGAACRELNQKLSRSEFMNDVVGSYAPVIIMMSDGAPTDEYGKELDNLKMNNWFNAAEKVAIAIGDDAKKDVLAEFTGNIERVITVHTPEELEKWIKFVSVTASKIGSQSSSAGQSKGSEITEAINNGPDSTPVAELPSGGSSQTPDGTFWG